MKTCDVCGNEFNEYETKCPFCGSRKGDKNIIKVKSPKYVTFNIKEDMPTVSTASFRLRLKLNQLKKDGVGVVKIIHGYGSSGVGGSIRDAIRDDLRNYRFNGMIKFFVFGENFFSREKDVIKLMHLYPLLKNDHDLNRKNRGVTIVVL